MKIEFALTCRTFSGRGSELDLQSVGADTFWCANLPASVDFAVVLGLVGTRTQFARGSDVEAYLLGPGMARLAELSFDIARVDFPDGYPEDWRFSHLHPLAVTFDALDHGEHVLDLYAPPDGRASVFFRVARP